MGPAHASVFIPTWPCLLTHPPLSMCTFAGRGHRQALSHLSHGGEDGHQAPHTPNSPC